MYKLFLGLWLCLFLNTNLIAQSQQVKVNQIGFYPESKKIAIVPSPASDSFEIINNKSGEVVFSGVLSAPKTWSSSGETLKVANFSEVKEEGEYYVKVEGCLNSYPFQIAKDVNYDLVKSAIKSFYFNRCSFELKEEFAGVYARKAGHPDTDVVVHNSAASVSRPAGTKISSPGGWYDAGDYGKYIVNSGISTYTLLAAYEAFPDFFDRLKLNIPESSNELPDLLDEALYNLRWMLTMQDPEDGSVYHKLTTANFCGMVMPEEDIAQRYVIGRSTAAALDFAAVCAVASRIFKKFNSIMPGFSDTCLSAALKAWKWARENPDSSYSNSKTTSPRISTGEYGDNDFTDEFVWAATELYIATKQDSFFTIAFPSGELLYLDKIPSWPNVATLSLYSLLLCKDELQKVSSEKIKDALNTLVNPLLTTIKNSAYNISMSSSDFYWGSNGVAANKGMAFAIAYLGTGKDDFRTAAIDMLDYLLGRNPTGYCFVTGAGDKSPMFIHHRPSTADSIKEPVPGFLVGGPNSALQDTNSCGGNYYPSKLPALAYLDSVCSYASNEIAINWNAPFVFLAGAIESLYGNSSAEIKTSRKKVFYDNKCYIGYKNKRLQLVFSDKESRDIAINDIRGRLIWKERNFIRSSLIITPFWQMQTLIVTIKSNKDNKILTKKIPLLRDVN